MTLTLVAVASRVFAGTTVLTRLRAADTWRHQDGCRVAAEFHVGEAFEDRHAARTAHVKRYGHSCDSHVVHATEEAALHVLETDDRRVLLDFRAQVEIVRLQI